MREQKSPWKQESVILMPGNLSKLAVEESQLSYEENDRQIIDKLSHLKTAADNAFARTGFATFAEFADMIEIVHSTLQLLKPSTEPGVQFRQRLPNQMKLISVALETLASACYAQSTVTSDRNATEDRTTLHFI